MPVLVELETDEWRLEIVGRVPELPTFLTLTANTRIDVQGSASLSVFNRATKRLARVDRGTAIEPLLFENTDYDFYLERKGAEVDADLSLPATASLRHQFGRVNHYSLNFRNDVGFFELKVASTPGTTTARLEVFPIKIDYRDDYIRMRDEVAEITRNLIMTVQSRTFGAAAAIPTRHPTLVEWLSIARGYFNQLEAAANAIARRPHSALHSSVVSVPIDRSRKVDNRYLARVLRKPVSRVGAQVLASGVTLPDRVPGVASRLSFDTPANRYIKALLIETKRNVQQLIRTTSTGDEDADLTAEEKFFEAARPEAKALLRRVQVLLSAPYLRAVSTVPAVRPTSMVLHHHPQYAAFVRVAQLFNGGLSAGGGPLQVGLKDIALLYEYWCFLKIMWLLRDDFELSQQTVVKLRHTKITVTLQKGFEAAITYRHKVTGKELLLVYNRFFNRLPTIAQRPDNVIQLASETNLYIFDAKYRLSFSQQYLQQFGGVGPTVDDIATMHRYRDAVVIPDKSKRGRYITRVVKGALVLFPYSDESSYRQHRFFESISAVEIGGLPFLPNASEMVVSKLTELLRDNEYLTEDEL
jgi:predicted component of viral defense system (DUF524 family)